MIRSTSRRSIFSVACLTALATTATSQAVIGRLMSSGPLAGNGRFSETDFGFTVFGTIPGYTDGSIGDWVSNSMYGSISRPAALEIQANNPNRTIRIPFQLLDDSVSIFPADTLGIIREDDNRPFFGVSNLRNFFYDFPSGSTRWSLDVSGFTEIELRVDIAAMGNFDVENDRYTFFAEIDTGPAPAILTATVNTGVEQDYTLANGQTFTYFDPLRIGAVTLTNNFTEFRRSFSETGDILSLTFEAFSDGGDEAFAWRNLRVLGVGPAGREDFNNDGEVNEEDLLLFLEDFNNNGDLADVDKNGTTDFFDVGDVLRNFPVAP